MQVSFGKARIQTQISQHTEDFIEKNFKFAISNNYVRNINLPATGNEKIMVHGIKGWGQNCGFSTANALEIPQPCTEPSICHDRIPSWRRPPNDPMWVPQADDLKMPTNPPLQTCPVIRISKETISLSRCSTYRHQRDFTVNFNRYFTCILMIEMLLLHISYLSTMVQVKARCRQATSHHLGQCGPKSWYH